MVRRLARIYLWIALVATFALGPVRQAAGTEVFILASAVHLALVAAAVWMAAAAEGPAGRAREHAAFLPGALLVAGPIALFMGASTGPPTPSQPGAYLFNTTGLLLGVLVVLLGYAALSARLWERGDRTWSVLGLAGLLVGVVLYALNMIFRYAQLAAGAADPFVEVERQVFPGLGNISFSPLAEPSWQVFMYIWVTLMLAAYAVTAYLAATSYAAALMRVGWINRTGGLVFVTLGLALALIMGAGWLFLSSPAVETMLFFLGVPFMSVVLPYFLGVVLLGRAGSEQPPGPVGASSREEPVGQRSGVMDVDRVSITERRET